ncbi:MAG: glycosyltransferase family 2 protein [Saprospiraceae bacterium]|jgi:glycosyltransferase involved in cell wall biosynthesis|nr:glycosyltransferase family 2 protein [Saprospiraceae bacterium]MDP4998766.1 glycosyltransferase family 2 protein [Saprospiraceae bacterium]
MDVSVVIPLLNEEESLEELAAWIDRVVRAHGLSCELVFVDDGSTDKSWQIIETLTQRYPHVKAIKFRRNYGKSAALNEGFSVVSGDVVITMDADLQDSPEEIPELVRLIREEGYDLISGWKKVRHDPLSKTIPSRLYNATVRWVSGIPLHDFNCGLKAYRREVVKAIEVYGEMHRYLPLMAKWAGFTKIGEKVVQHHPRKYGVSKFGLERFVNGFLDLMSITFVGKFGKRPMHFFGTLGILSFLMGFLVLLFLSFQKFYNATYGIAERPLFFLGILTVIIGVQLFVTGFLAELVVRNGADRNHYLVDKRIGE